MGEFRCIGGRFIWLCLLGSSICWSQPNTAGNLLKNFSFESPLTGSGWFGIWEIRGEVGARGTLKTVYGTRRSGNVGLKLAPNSRNIVDSTYFDYGLGQRISLEANRGKTILFQGWLGAEEGATAVLRVVAVSQNGNVKVRFVRRTTQTPENKALALVRDLFVVPDEPLKELFVICSVQGTTGAAYFDDITVSQQLASSLQMGRPDPGPALTAITSIDYENIIRDIPKSLYGANIEYVFNGMGLWNEYTKKGEAGILEMAREMGVSQYRFPGGLFANFYDWKNGIGPVETRPETSTTPNKDKTGHKFGTDEAVLVADATGVSLFITANALTGKVEDAVEWAKYINRGGMKAPIWEIGNELYFYRTTENAGDQVWNPDTYSDLLIEYSKALKGLDPQLKIAADIEYNMTLSGCGVIGATGCWTDVVLKKAADHIDYLALHSGLAPIILSDDSAWDLRTIYAGMLASPIEIKRLLLELSDKLDKFTGTNASRIKLAMVEWGPFFQADPRSPFIDHAKTLASALYTASMMKVLIETPKMEIAHSFTLVDPLTQGWLGLRDGKWVPRSPFFAIQLYAKHFGSKLLKSDVMGPTYYSHSVGIVPATERVPFLDVISSKDDQGDLRIIAVNKHFDRPMQVYFNVPGFHASGNTRTYTLSGTGLDANTGTQLPAAQIAQNYFAPQASISPNGRFYMGGPDEITLTGGTNSETGPCFSVEIPAHSVMAIVVPGWATQPAPNGACSAEGNNFNP